MVEHGNRPPFLDTFYGLSSVSSEDRAQAARDLLSYCSDDVADASYALRRLMNGLCSGRAAARQGNAAALSCLVKILYDSERLLAVLNHDEKARPNEQGGETSPLELLRQRLLKTTECADNVKGSEERDYQFGRLFGLQALIRCGCLETVQDLVDLFQGKKWMREPAAHAIALFLESNRQKKSFKNAKKIIRQSILSSSNVSWKAEEIAVAIVMNPDVLATGNVVKWADALSSTSHVIQPRVHLVWDVVFQCISNDDKNNDVGLVSTRTVNDFSVAEALMKHVVEKTLLSDRTTHERRALALCIVKTLLEDEFVSSLTGRSRLIVDSVDIEKTVLTPLVVRRLFLDTLTAGMKGGRGQGENILRPLVTSVLESVVEAAKTSNTRLALARSFARCNPRFDGQTKTGTIQALMFGSEVEDSELVEQYLLFLKGELTNPARTGGEVAGYMELLFRAGQAMRTSESKFGTEGRRCVLSVFFIFAFIDCRGLNPNSLRKKSRRKTSDTFKRLSTPQIMNPPSFEAREAASSRFFSLLSDSTRNLSEKESLDVYSSIRQQAQDLLKSGAVLYSSQTGTPAEEELSPEELVDRLCNLNTSSQEENRREEKFRAAVGRLASCLFAISYSCGMSDELEEDPDKDDDEDSEAVHTFLSDLHDLIEQHDSGSLNLRGVVESFAELLPLILSSPLCVGSSSKGSAPKAIRDAVSETWTALLMHASSAESVVVTLEVVKILLRAVGVDDEDGESHAHESNESSDDSEDDGDSSSEESSNSKEKDTSSRNEPTDERKLSSAGKDLQTDDEEIQLNPSKLQGLLEEELDDQSVDEDLLEHHEGADAALARLLQLKQEARKAGKKAAERIELKRRLRCLPLLSALLSGKPEGWLRLLRADVVQEVVVPLISYKQALEKSISAATGHQDVTLPEKKALRDRLSAVISSKLLKLKAGSLVWSSRCDITEEITQCSSTVMQSARKADIKEHQELCSSVVAFCIRTHPDPKAQAHLAGEILSDLVKEWSTKRTSRLHTACLEQFIRNAPVLSQCAMVPLLLEACASARSSFLKSESFRLLTSLFNPKLQSHETILNSLSACSMEKSMPHALKVVVETLNDPEMAKSKRLKTVLVCAEKILTFGFDASEHAAIIGNVNNVVGALGKGASLNKLVAKCTAACEQLLGSTSPATDKDVVGDEKKNKSGKNTEKRSKTKKKKRK